LPPELQGTLPNATLAGQSTMTFWGFEVYQATLWVAPGFTETAFEQSAFVLDWRICATSRVPTLPNAPLRNAPPSAHDCGAGSGWEGQMRALFPDVKKGDRITGVHQPGTGACSGAMAVCWVRCATPSLPAVFWHLAQPQTSEPQLRRRCWRRPRTYGGARVTMSLQTASANAASCATAAHPAREPSARSLRVGDGLRYGLLGLPLAFCALPLYVLMPNLYAKEWGVSLAALGALLLGARLCWTR
jgi:hypothetical protein